MSVVLLASKQADCVSKLFCCAHRGRPLQGPSFLDAVLQERSSRSLAVLPRLQVWWTGQAQSRAKALHGAEITILAVGESLDSK